MLEPPQESLPDEQQADTSALITRVQTQLRDSVSQRALAFLTLVNLLILYGRPQDLVPIFGTTKIPLILSLLPLPFVIFNIDRVWKSSTEAKAMLGFFVLGAAWVPYAHNNFWAFQSWRDIAQQYFCFLFPILLCMANGTRLKKIVRCLCFVCICLSAYALLHCGRGPGGFVGDENDLALALLAILGLPLLLAPSAPTTGARFAYLFTSAALLAGVIATRSRGGFLGLVALLAFTYTKSTAKLAMAVLGSVLILGAVLLAPQDYWSEMSTIRQTDQGTAKERRRIWAVAIKVWLYPTHIVFGSGMGNTPYWLGEFEPTTNRGDYSRSFAGRAVHSSFFQLLSDLGVAGFLLMAITVWASFFGNNRMMKRLKLLSSRVSEASTLLRNEELQEKLAAASGEKGRDHTGERWSIISRTQNALYAGEREVRYLIGLLTGINACWAGALMAGLFISVLYYPPFWLLAVLGVAARQYARTLAEDLFLLAQRVEETRKGG